MLDVILLIKYVTLHIYAYLYDYPINNPPISLTTWPKAIAPAAYFPRAHRVAAPKHSDVSCRRPLPSPKYTNTKHEQRAASPQKQPFNDSKTKTYENNELEYRIGIKYTITYALNRQYYLLSSYLARIAVSCRRVVVCRPIRRRCHHKS